MTEQTEYDPFIVSVVHKLNALIAERRITRQELAKRLGVSKSRVSQMLGGASSNLTLKTLCSVSNALGVQVTINFEPKVVYGKAY